MQTVLRSFVSAIVLSFIITVAARAQSTFWWQTPFDVPGDTVTAIATSTGGTVVVGTSHSGLFRSTNHGAAWEARNGNLSDLRVRGVITGPAGIPTPTSMWMLAFTAGGGAFTTVDGGATWRRDHNLPESIIESVTPGDDLSSMGVSVATGNGIYRLTSRSVGIDSITTAWDTAGLQGKHITDVVLGHARRVNGETSYLAFATDAEGKSYQGRTQNVSGNLFIEWTPSTLPTPGFSAMARSVNLLGDSLIFAGSGRQIFRSTNYGSTWQSLYFPGDTITAMVLNHRKHIFVGTVDGILRSTDTGETWVRLDEGLNHKGITTLKLDPMNGYIYAGTVSGKVYRTVGNSSVERDREMAESALALMTEPNPASTEATISFVLPQADRVTLAIYDMTGAEVARLLDRRLEAGAHTASWQSTGFPAGLYHCRLQAGETITSRVIVVQR